MGAVGQDPATEDQRFEKSRSNKRTENLGLALLLQDPRFQMPDQPTKKRIIELLPVSGAFGAQTFDAVMLPEGGVRLTAENVADYMEKIRLVEMKTTKKPIRDASLNRFFFGATEREYDMARALGDKYLFAFVVLNDDNVFGRPFVVLLTLSEVERRTRSRRIQYQVNFRSDMVIEDSDEDVPLVIRAAEDPAPYRASPEPMSDL